MTMFPYHLWADFFANGKESDAQTRTAIDFVGQAVHLDKNDAILDAGCGNGRHAIELVARGYNVTGLDISPEMLERAAVTAKRRGFDLPLIKHDMATFVCEKKFDVIINMYQSFGYMHTDQDVLEHLAQALRPGGKLLLDLRNPGYVLPKTGAGEQVTYGKKHQLGDANLEMDEEVEPGNRWRLNYRFKLPNKELDAHMSIRLYNLDELTDMLKKAGLEVSNVWGGYDAQAYDEKASERLIVLAKLTKG